jgi:hypothetical protein
MKEIQEVKEHKTIFTRQKAWLHPDLLKPLVVFLELCPIQVAMLVPQNL